MIVITAMISWLVVVWNMTGVFFHKYWECHHPNWRTHIFQRGRYSTNQVGCIWGEWKKKGRNNRIFCAENLRVEKQKGKYEWRWIWIKWVGVDRFFLKGYYWKTWMNVEDRDRIWYRRNNVWKSNMASAGLSINKWEFYGSDEISME